MDNPSPTPATRPFSRHNPQFFQNNTPSNPPPRITAANSPPTRQDSSNSTASRKGDELDSGKLTDEEKVAIFKGCLDLRREWLEKGGSELFWTGVAQRVKVSTGREYTWQLCQWNVENEITRRFEDPRSLDTSKVSEPVSDLDKTIDMWIEVETQRYEESLA